MKAYDFVHLALHALGDKIQGRTKLQKTIYFTGVLTGLLEALGYRPHFYGPYSSEVAGAVGRLLGLGFLEQRTLSSGAVDSQGFEVARFDYLLTEDGKLIAEEKAKEHLQEWKKIKDAVERLKQFTKTDYVKLSIAAKLFFLLDKKGGPATLDEIRETTPKFGWEVQPDQLLEAAKLLESVGLVTIQ